MITACELCTKNNVENALREEATRIAKAKVAKGFAEEVIAPILEKLTEIPDHLKIGFRYSGPNARGLFTGVGEWHHRVTHYGNDMAYRDFTHEIKGKIGDYTMLDYEILNQYLAQFGFQISTERKMIITKKYSSSTSNEGVYVDFLCLSMTCPLEEN